MRRLATALAAIALASTVQAAETTGAVRWRAAQFKK
jgi:hypothetical protein